MISIKKWLFLNFWPQLVCMTIIHFHYRRYHDYHTHMSVRRSNFADYLSFESTTTSTASKHLYNIFLIITYILFVLLAIMDGGSMYGLLTVLSIFGIIVLILLLLLIDKWCPEKMHLVDRVLARTPNRRRQHCTFEVVPCERVAVEVDSINAIEGVFISQCSYE